MPKFRATSAYLLFYNSICAAGWAYVARALLLKWVLGTPQDQFFRQSLPVLLCVQSLAILEILHSVIGIVKSPILSGIMQVASRLFVTWFVLYPHQTQIKHNPFYQSLMLAWSFTEVVRYSFYAFNILKIKCFPLLLLRYNAFFILYPLGVISEIALTLNAADLIKTHKITQNILRFVIVPIYLPGLYFLYTYMIRQRQRVLYRSRTRN